MYLGTNEPTLQIAKTLRNEEIQLASNYRTTRTVRRSRNHNRSTWSRITRPVRRSD
jgi:hypothetical protein